MIRTRPLATLAAASAAFAMSGCISLLPKAEPAQLYRFGGDPQAVAPSSGSKRAVALAAVQFDQAASGDRILTTNGQEAAYISGARWVAPAETLFEQAVQRAFATASATRLIERGQATASTMTLDLRVERFEARYDRGEKAAPTAVVAVRARLIRFPDRAIVAERLFQASEAAADDRVGAIVPAIDSATGSVLRDLATWTDQIAAGR